MPTTTRDQLLVLGDLCTGNKIEVGNNEWFVFKGVSFTKPAAFFFASRNFALYTVRYEDKESAEKIIGAFVDMGDMVYSGEYANFTNTAPFFEALTMESTTLEDIAVKLFS